MHRVDIKRRKKKILRVIAYGITLTLTVLTTVLLLYIALGYRLDRESGNVVRSGLLLVDSKPEAAAIYINNEQKDNEAPGRFVLSAGDYDLRLTRAGYREWNKKVSVVASGVREVNYPLLIPENLKTTTMVESPDLDMISQSLDRKYILSHSANQTTLTLTELQRDAPKQTILSLSGAVTRENGQVGKLSVIEWALNNKHVLLKQTLPNGSTQYLSMDVTRPSEIINITSLLGQEAPEDIHYVGSNTDQIYGLLNGVLKKYNLSSKEAQTLMQNVRSYQPYSNDTILFDRATTQESEIGILKDDTTTIVERSSSDSLPTFLKYAKYDGDDYFIVTHPDLKITVYKNPTKKPVLAKQLPLVSLDFKTNHPATFSNSARFIVAQNGPEVMTYDFDELKLYTFKMPFEIDASSVVWFDAFHLQMRESSGKSYITDFDGGNRQEMAPIIAGSRLYFAPNYQFMYSYAVAPQGVALQTTPLVAK